MNMNQKTKIKKTAFAVTMVAGMAFGGIMAEKAYSKSIQAQQNAVQVQPAPTAVERVSIKDQLDPRKWDYQKRKMVGGCVGTLLGTLFILVKGMRDTEMEIEENRKKNQKQEQNNGGRTC